MASRAVLMKTGLRPLNTGRPDNTAHPKTTFYNARPMPKAVNTARPRPVNTYRPRVVNTTRPIAVNTARPNLAVVNVVRENQGHPQHVQEDQGYVDSGCSRHMIGNMSYFSDFKKFDRGYVIFGGGANGGRITGKLTTAIDVNAVEVAFLEKPTESKGFEQIIDFLNANSIKYALTVNPTIYTSCIKQFWAMTKVKTVNGEEQIQALVDKKKVIITETSVRSDIHLQDAEGTECLPTAKIFEQLTLVRYENLTQKLTFYKAFFSPQ
nr:hypothetical protein [Tanacetum cinerariifolium]